MSKQYVYGNQEYEDSGEFRPPNHDEIFCDEDGRIECARFDFTVTKYHILYPKKQTIGILNGRA